MKSRASPAFLVACTGVGHKNEKPGKPGFSVSEKEKTLS